MATVFFSHSSSVHLRPGGTLEAAAMAGSKVKLVGGTGSWKRETCESHRSDLGMDPNRGESSINDGIVGMAYFQTT